MSDGDSTFNRRITKPYFRTCSTCWSRSQPALYFYARFVITNHDEASFGLLRYSLGGYRPSKTARLTLSSLQLQGVLLDSQLVKTSISLAAPSCLTTRLRSLLAILHKTSQEPISEYSKGSRGLSVLLRVNSIFTATTISPSLSLRQRPDRYTIRAGRNLPDKEFRYLRTVIVTAAIHRGFNSTLCPCGLTSPFDLSALGRYHTLYVVLDDLAECCVFVKQSPGPFHCDLKGL